MLEKNIESEHKELQFFVFLERLKGVLSVVNLVNDISRHSWTGGALRVDKEKHVSHKILNFFEISENKGCFQKSLANLILKISSILLLNLHVAQYFERR